MINFSLFPYKNVKYFPKLYSLTHFILTWIMYTKDPQNNARKGKKQSGELNSVKMFQLAEEK